MTSTAPSASASATAASKLKATGERFDSLSASLTEYRRTNRFIQTDGTDFMSPTFTGEVRAILGIKYMGCKYSRNGHITAHRVLVVTDSPIILVGQQPGGTLCLPLNDDVLADLGVDTSRMAPEDFVVPLRHVSAGERLTRQDLVDFELFTRKWVDSLLRSLHAPSKAASPAVSAAKAKRVTTEDLLLESNFPWKCLERETKSQKSYVRKNFEKRVEARRMKAEEEARGSDDSTDEDESSVSGSASATGRQSMEAFLAMASEVLGKHSLSRLQRVISGAPKRGAKRGLSDGNSDAPAGESSAAAARRAPKRARRPAASSAPSATTASSSSAADSAEQFETASEHNSDDEEERRQLRLAEHLSLIESDPTKAPEEIRRKADANLVVERAGGVDAFVRQVDSSAGAADASQKSTLCITCLNEADIHTLCESNRGKVTLQQPNDMHRTVCFGCWKKLMPKDRLTCLQCHTRINAAYHITKNGNTTSVKKI